MLPMGARATSAPAPEAYAGISTATGAEYSFDRRPGISQVSDTIHGVSPYATSKLGSGGVSEAQANSVYLAGVEGVPGLLCLAGLPCPSGFPPPFPTQANAQYPSQQSADAPAHGGTVGGHGAPLAATPGTVHAEAHLLSALAKAADNSTQFFTKAVTTGSMTTSTSQSINSAGAVVDTAEALANDINILQVPHVGPFIHIGAVHSVTSITYNGTDKPVVVNTTTVSGVSVLGLPATIDASGIHIVGQSNSQVQDILNQQLSFLLNANYTTITVIGATNTAGDHSMQTRSGSLLISFDDTVAGAPKTPPVSDIPYCKRIFKLALIHKFDPILSQVPVVFCTPPQPPDVNAEYFGTVNIGSVGAVLSAANYTFVTEVPGANLGGVLPGAGGPSSSFVAGTPGTAGTSGTPGLTGTGGLTGQNQNPQVAGSNNNPVGFVENLGDAAKRLKYLFPALLLAVIGILAGRIGRAPARLPRVTA
jgi:hypothetical protein